MWVTENCLAIRNADVLTNYGKNVFNNTESTFTFVLNKEPKIAEEISKNCEVIIGVKSLNYVDSENGISHQTNPTMRSPEKYILYYNFVGCEVVNVILRDKRTGLAYAQHDFIPSML